MSYTQPTVDIEISGQVATLTINRPGSYNASTPMWRASCAPTRSWWKTATTCA